MEKLTLQVSPSDAVIGLIKYHVVNLLYHETFLMTLAAIVQQLKDENKLSDFSVYNVIQGWIKYVFIH